MRETIYINGKDIRDFGAEGQRDYTISGTQVTNEYFQGRNRTSYVVLASFFGMKTIQFTLVFSAKTRHEALLNKSCLDALLFGKPEIYMPDGFYYSCILNSITGADGYVIAVKDDNGTWKEILFLDTPSAETAKNVLRINTNGIGFSTNGVNGPYRNAWTIDGSLVADFITTGVLTANLIKAGVLQSLNGATSINMETGEASLTGSITTASDGFQVTLGNGAISFYFNGVKVGDLSQVTYGNQKDLQINASRAVFSGRNLSEASQVQIGASSTHDSVNYFAYPFILARKGTGLSCSFSVQPNSSRTEMVLELNGTEYGKKTATIDGQTITYLGPI